MIVVIDGYNLLKGIFSHNKDNLGKQRDYLISQLGTYKHHKGQAITEIVLVFDGGMTDKASREVRSGVVVIYAGRGKSADRWIEKFTERNRHRAILVVSNDKRMVNHCRNRGADSIRIDEFYPIMLNTLAASSDATLETQEYADSLQKYDAEPLELEAPSSFDERMVDVLMEQASMHKVDKQPEEVSDTKRTKGASQTLGKQEKRKQRTIKKLL